MCVWLLSNTPSETPYCLHNYKKLLISLHFLFLITFAKNFHHSLHNQRFKLGLSLDVEQ